MGNRVSEPDRICKEDSLQSNASGDVEQWLQRLMAEAGLARKPTPGSASRQPPLSSSRSDAMEDIEVSSVAMLVIRESQSCRVDLPVSQEI